MILWYDGDGSMGMIEMFFEHPKHMFCFRIKKNNFQPLLSRAILDFSLTVKAATLIFISGRGLAILSAEQGKSGSIYNLVKN